MVSSCILHFRYLFTDKANPECNTEEKEIDLIGFKQMLDVSKNSRSPILNFQDVVDTQNIVVFLTGTQLFKLLKEQSMKTLTSS